MQLTGAQPKEPISRDSGCCSAPTSTLMEGLPQVLQTGWGTLGGFGSTPFPGSSVCEVPQDEATYPKEPTERRAVLWTDL